MDYGEKLYVLRKQKSLSQEEVANALGVSRQSISLWETNQASPSMDNLIAIAKLFKVSLDELVGISETETISIEVNDDVKYEIKYEEDKRIIYRRDYQYINTPKELVLFIITFVIYPMALSFFLRATQLVLDVARVFLIIGFVLIIIGSSIYPLYLYTNIKKKLAQKNKIMISFYDDHISVNEEKIEYKMMDYFINKRDYIIIYVIKGNRIYVPKYNHAGLSDYLSKRVERRNRKKPIWKHI